MDAVFAGADPHGLIDELRRSGADVTTIDGIADRAALDEAGIDGADLYVLTDAGQATSIPVARERNPDVRVVVYTGDSLPEFVSGQEVLAVDPALLDASAVAEEIADGA